MNFGKDRTNMIIEGEEELDDLCCKAYEISIMVGGDPEHDDDCPRAGQMSDYVKYTLVRHRDARSDQRMQFGIEVAPVRSPELVERIKAAGGFVFEDEETADEVAQIELVPPDSEDDGWPHATGWFDWQVTVMIGRQAEPIYKYGFTHPAIEESAKQAFQEAGPSLYNILHAMQEMLGGGTERAFTLGLQEAGFTIKKGKVTR